MTKTSPVTLPGEVERVDDPTLARRLEALACDCDSTDGWEEAAPDLRLAASRLSHPVGQGVGDVERHRFTGDQSDLRMRFNEAIAGGPNMNGDSGWIIHTQGHASDLERAIERIAALQALLESDAHNALRAYSSQAATQPIPVASPGYGSCDLCASECRGHSLGHEGQWQPEPGSRAYGRQQSYEAGLAEGRFSTGAECRMRIALEAIKDPPTKNGFRELALWMQATAKEALL